MKRPVRELYEETGIHAGTGEIILEWTLTTDSMLRDFYMVHKDVGLDRLRLQSTEVCAAKWVSFDRLEEMAQNGQTTRTVARWLENRGEELRRKVRDIAGGINALGKGGVNGSPEGRYENNYSRRRQGGILPRQEHAQPGI